MATDAQTEAGGNVRQDYEDAVMDAADEERNDVVPGSSAAGDLDMSTVLYSTVLHCSSEVQCFASAWLQADAMQQQRWPAICRGTTRTWRSV
jgi:hypothetical protein